MLQELLVDVYGEDSGSAARTGKNREAQNHAKMQKKIYLFALTYMPKFRNQKE